MRNGWGPVALISQLGFTLVASILLGLVLGLWIDAQLGTRPWATLILSLLGILAGSFAAYRLVARSIEQAVEERRQHQNHEDREG
ncbi:MAG: AtpZ/AtpI family protein [Chloroflexi bacterium]|jgi:ATP synthase protein I|nr:AtpZ/AtpI family protein [Chloroflexota bacterium]HLG50026.1 AtpZ/AtpI family protein [Chloroflexota bacterium]